MRFMKQILLILATLLSTVARADLLPPPPLDSTFGKGGFRAGRSRFLGEFSEVGSLWTDDGNNLQVLRMQENGIWDVSFKALVPAFDSDDKWASRKLVLATAAPGGFFTVLRTGSNVIPAYRNSYLTRHKASGAVDTKFGNAGTFALNSSTDDLNYRYISSILVDPRGRVVLLLKRCVPEGNISFGACEMSVTRLTANGRVDSSFGKGGTLQLGAAGIDDSVGMSFLAGDDLQIVRRGWDSSRIVVYHVRAGDQAPTTWMGSRALDLSSAFEGMNCTLVAIGAVSADGTPVAAYCPSQSKFLLRRITVDAEFDPGFGTVIGPAISFEPYFFADPSRAGNGARISIAVSPSGGYTVVISRAGLDLLFIRFDSAGRPMTTFGAAGMAQLPLPFVNDGQFDVAYDLSNRVLVTLDNGAYRSF